MTTCPPRPEPCEKLCAMAAREGIAKCQETYEAALLACEAAEDPTACETAAKEALAACTLEVNTGLEECLKGCGHEPPPPPTCEERCDKAAEQVAAECKDMGGSEEECAAAVEEFVALCKERCASSEPPDPCGFECAELGAKAKQRCLDAGGNEQTCDPVALAAQARCEAAKAELCKVEGIALNAAPFAFRRGDANGDGKRDISDPIQVLGGLFLGKGGLSCADAADANDDGIVDISDAVALLQHLFMGGGSLPEPADEGQDPTADALICE
jgi:hypothetical protein